MTARGCAAHDYLLYHKFMSSRVVALTLLRRSAYLRREYQSIKDRVIAAEH